MKKLTTLLMLLLLASTALAYVMPENINGVQYRDYTGTDRQCKDNLLNTPIGDLKDIHAVSVMEGEGFTYFIGGEIYLRDCSKETWDHLVYNLTREDITFVGSSHHSAPVEVKQEPTTTTRHRMPTPTKKVFTGSIIRRVAPLA